MRYENPSIESYNVNVESLLAAQSIANNGTTEDDIQHKVDENNQDGFWAGGKKNNFDAWTTWDDDDDQ